MSHITSIEHPAVETVRYEMYPWWRALLYGGAAFIALLAVMIAVNVASNGSAGGIAFFAVWLVGMSGGWFFYTCRVAYVLILSGETLTWVAAARQTRRVAVAEVVAIRPFGPFGGMAAGGGVIEAIDLADGSRLLVMVRKGLPQFASELASRRPGIPVEFGWYSDLCERLRRESGFSRDRQP